jgi:serine/threonine-protein kinase
MELPKVTVDELRGAIPAIEAIEPPRQGGQKLVFPCTISGQRCALKVMLRNPTAQPGSIDDSSAEESDEVTARARREVQIMGACRSPHIVRLGPLPLMDVDIGGQGVICFSEEWIQGRDLRAIIHDGPLPLVEVVRLGKDVAEAVQALWSCGKVHRDVKPGNIMRREPPGDFVLLDMGFALDLEDASLTPFGLVPGTLIYLSPEQTEVASKRQMDFRSDLFSLGIVLYEAATAHHPFWEAGVSSREALGRILGSKVAAPSVHRSEIPVEMDEIILRLLAKRPHLRYRTCAQLIAALDAIPLGAEGR